MQFSIRIHNAIIRQAFVVVSIFLRWQAKPVYVTGLCSYTNSLSLLWGCMRHPIMILVGRSDGHYQWGQAMQKQIGRFTTYCSSAANKALLSFSDCTQHRNISLLWPSLLPESLSINFHFGSWSHTETKGKKKPPSAPPSDTASAKPFPFCIKTIVGFPPVS